MSELYQITFMPQTIAASPLPAPSARVDAKAGDAGSSSAAPVKKSSAYVPPHLRGQQQAPSAPRALHELLNEDVQTHTSSSPSSSGTQSSSPAKDKKGKEKEKEKGKKEKKEGDSEKPTAKEAPAPLSKEG